MTISDLAQRYQVSEDSIRRWIKAKKIPFTLTGPTRVQAIDPAPLVREVPATAPQSTTTMKVRRPQPPKRTAAPTRSDGRETAVGADRITTA